MTDPNEHNPTPSDSPLEGAPERVPGEGAPILAEIITPEEISPEILAILIEDLPDRALRSSLLELSKRIGQGESPEKAVEQLGADVPDSLRGFVTAGVRVGRLPEMLEHYLRQRAKSRLLWRSLWMKLAYPAIVLIFTGMIILFTLLFVAPAFDDAFNGFGIDLPYATTSLIHTSREVRRLVYDPMLPIALGILFFTPIVARLVFGRAALDRLRRGLPVVGPLWDWCCLGEFTRVLGLLIRFHVPLPEALRITGDAIHDRELGQVCLELSLAVEEGREMSESIENSPQFPASMVPLIHWGLHNDSLADSLEILGDMCEERVRLESDWLKATLPPIAFILVVCGAFFTIISLYLPLVYIIQALT